jgi:hypothetical protein
MSSIGGLPPELGYHFGMKKFSAMIFLAVLSTNAAMASDTVDLQWAVCDSSPHAVLKKIDEQDAKMKPGEITYFESIPVRFTAEGISFRIKTEKGTSTSSLKVRFTEHQDLPEAECEWDNYGGQETYACAVNSELSDGENFWSREQLEFLARNSRFSSASGLKSFGPYETKKWKFKHEGNKVNFDNVKTPVGNLMEFSLKVPYEERKAAAEEFGAWLNENGITLCQEQEGKTLRLLRALGLL